MKTAIKHLFTGVDNRTLDLGRVVWALMAVSYILLTVYHLIKSSGQFDAMAWGSGAAAILACGGGALAIKSHTEPKQ